MNEKVNIGRIKNVYVMLSITGRDLNPEDVSAALLLTPTRAFRRGDTFQAGGRPHPRAYGAWTLSTEEAVASEELLDHVQRLLSWILPIREQLKSFLAHAGVRTAVAFWWEPTDGPVGFSFPSAEVKVLAELCDEFDFYFG